MRIVQIAKSPPAIRDYIEQYIQEFFPELFRRSVRECINLLTK